MDLHEEDARRTRIGTVSDEQCREDWSITFETFDVYQEGRTVIIERSSFLLDGDGTPEEVDRQVQTLIQDIGPGGGYVVTSGNSLAGYLEPDNVIAMSEAVRKYGNYPLQQ